MLELPGQPLRRDVSRLAVPLLILPGLAFALSQVPMAAVLCPLLVGPWLWWRRERFWLDHCRVIVDGEALRVCYGQRQLVALDLRYATRQFTASGDLVLSEGDASYLALGVDPPEHAYPAAQSDSGAPDAQASAGSHAELDRAETQEPLLGSWRAVRLTRMDLLRLCTHVAAVPTCPPPDRDDVGALLLALGSVGATGRRVEELLSRLAHDDGAQARPGGLLTMLRERSLEQGRAGDAARRILTGPAGQPAAHSFIRANKIKVK